MENPRTFRIDRGIGQYDFNDYYAVLGLPITAHSSVVRKRYLLIAKSLHPDVHGRSPSEKEVSTQYLSKLVNPAYNVLSQERERTEYSALLKLLGKRMIKRNQKFLPQSNIAKRYLTSSPDVNYEETIREISKVQYEDLGQILEKISILSELNLVYILLQEGYKPAPSPQSVNDPYKSNIAKPAGDDTDITTNQTRVNDTGVNKTSSAYSSSAGGSYQMRSDAQASLRNNNMSNAAANTSAKNTNNSSNNNQTSNKNADTAGSANQHIRQAEIYVSQKLWSSALNELRGAMQVDCNNSKCHALLGFVYMNQKLSGMAKVSFKQALKLNPDEPIAKQYIDQVSGTNAGGSNASKPDAKAKSEKKGGFFGWLGGE